MTSETTNESLDKALQHCLKSLEYWEAIGNHRLVAMGMNNQGYLLVTLGRFEEAEKHLVRARKLFDAVSDKRRCAQVDDSLARLYLTADRLDLAEQAAERAVKIHESGSERYLADSLTTQGLVWCKLRRLREAKRVLDRAYQVAERSGDTESACAALLTIIEQMSPHLEESESAELIDQLDQFLTTSQNNSTLERVKNIANFTTSLSDDATAPPG